VIEAAPIAVAPASTGDTPPPPAAWAVTLITADVAATGSSRAGDPADAAGVVGVVTASI
jgi:hypothetical protein